VTANLYPQTEPYDHGMLDVGDGNHIYWETCGNPDGKPALVVHGGPGSGAGTWWRRYFDPARYNVVLVDQRNCGRSTPDAELHLVEQEGHGAGGKNTRELILAALDRFAETTKI
jgi:proline iminopeptidase